MLIEFNEIKEPHLDDQLLAFEQSELDLILVEGFKAENFPKIELHRPSLNKDLIFPNDPSIIAIATDSTLNSAQSSPTQLDLNNPRQITQYILQHFLGHTND